MPMPKLDEQLYALVQSVGHITAEDAYLACRANNTKASMASVYRVLDKLSADGRIHRIPVAGAADIFDMTTADHAHLICRTCGTVTDFPVDAVRADILPHAGENCRFDLVVYHTCAGCSGTPTQGIQGLRPQQ